MGYTYDDMIKKAQQEGVYDKFTQQDLTAAQKSPEYGMALTGLLTTLGTATTDEQRVLTTEYINRLRKNYGVTDASTANRLIAPGQSGTLDVTDADTYKTVLNDLINQPAFRYDPTQDPTYTAYEKMYRREGERAVADTLAKAAAMTGGRPSSYAISAAQQAGNSYAAALADMIPTLRQNAYSEYLQDFENKRAIASVLQGAASKDDSEGDDLTGDKTGGTSWADRFAQGYVDRFDRPAENATPEDQTASANTVNEVVKDSDGVERIVIGGQKYTWWEIAEMVKDGTVVEEYDPVNKTYRYYIPHTQQNQYNIND